MEAALLLLILGVNVTLWTLIGGCRLASERIMRRPDRPHRRVPPEARLSAADVAVLIPAHNEEPVIAATIASVLRLVPVQNVHVIADGCDDATAAIARTRGVNVLELNPGRGKAGGIETAIRLLRLRDRYAVVLIADADTELDELYLERGLPMLDEPGVVALAGYARSSWRPQELSPVGRFLVSYRTRLYAVMQWLKYGQTWRWTNVTAIVPGFASMYRTSILDAMDLNPPGLVIEDFNMTFEVHRKRLGKIAFRPAVHATAQDPDNFRDYYRQVLRWNLGFLQTVRRHKLWPSAFCAALVIFLAEVLVASVSIVLVVGWLVIDGTFVLVSEGLQAIGLLAGPIGPDLPFLSLTNLLLFVALPDYLLTFLTAVAMRRPGLLLYGVGFLGLRFVDATTMLVAIPMVWRTRSNGQWKSPARRSVAAAPAEVIESREMP
jgi:cellulose synthase/poly-beta-1,6-N-acetylglucosamine synthase-like glycosyltransferase